MERVSTVRSLLALCMCVVLSACASHGSRVKCDGRLEPINMPAAKQHSGIPATLESSAPPASPGKTTSSKDRP